MTVVVSRLGKANYGPLLLTPPSECARRSLSLSAKAPIPPSALKAIGCLKIAWAIIRTGIMGVVIAVRVRVCLKACSAVLPTKAC